MPNYAYILALCCLSFCALGQTVEGYVRDENAKVLDKVNVSVVGEKAGTVSDKSGFYRIKLSPNQFQELSFSFIGYNSKTIKVPMLKQGQTYTLNVNLNILGIDIGNVEINDQQTRTNTFEAVDVKNVGVLPSTSGGVEGLIKTLPGVSSSSELSSQYTVRGGNFDENLVYVNGIEVYRPFLVRSGQQEGLSFVNSDLVSSINFSAGGYAAQYGDKMSSVLDINYKQPNEFGASATLSLLGANAHIQGHDSTTSISYLLGVRHKANQYLLNSLETKENTNPVLLMSKLC